MTRAGTDETPAVLAGRYWIGDRLARGGMGEVWAGHDERLARDVAIKFLHPELVAHDGARRRFEVEARAAARLVHPNVVTVYDCGEDGDVPFLIMERLPGATLRDELAAGPMPVERACALAVEILTALQAAHDAGILHRDVKPGNVLLTDAGHAKVTDFGIAKLVEASDRTLTTELLATPVYLAPERFGGAPASRQSDVYSVGVLLYEALAGRRPFDGSSPAAVFAAVQQGDVEPLGRARPDVASGIEGVVMRAMDPEPARRFASAAEMAATLAAATGEPATDGDAPAPTVAVIPTPTTSVMEPPPRAARGAEAHGHHRRRRLLALIVAAFLVVAVAVGIVVSQDDGPVEPDATTDTTTAVSATARPSAEPELPGPLEQSIDELERLTSR